MERRILYILFCIALSEQIVIIQQKSDQKTNSYIYQKDKIITKIL